MVDRIAEADRRRWRREHEEEERANAKGMKMRHAFRDGDFRAYDEAKRIRVIDGEEDDI
jgi:hypothetical protein